MISSTLEKPARSSQVIENLELGIDFPSHWGTRKMILTQGFGSLKGVTPAKVQ